MKYHLYDENYTHKGSFTSITQMRNYLCERKYDNDDKSYANTDIDGLARRNVLP